MGAMLALTACTSPHPNAVKNVAGHEVALYVTPGVSNAGNDIRVEVRGPRIPDISSVAISRPNENVREVELSDSGTGSYDASNVRFSSAGTWHVSVLEQQPNGSSKELTSFDVAVK